MPQARRRPDLARATRQRCDRARRALGHTSKRPHDQLRDHRGPPKRAQPQTPTRRASQRPGQLQRIDHRQLPPRLLRRNDPGRRFRRGGDQPLKRTGESRRAMQGVRLGVGALAVFVFVRNRTVEGLRDPAPVHGEHMQGVSTGFFGGVRSGEPSGAREASRASCPCASRRASRGASPLGGRHLRHGPPERRG